MPESTAPPASPPEAKPNLRDMAMEGLEKAFAARAIAPHAADFDPDSEVDISPGMTAAPAATPPPATPKPPTSPPPPAKPASAVPDIPKKAPPPPTPPPSEPPKATTPEERRALTAQQWKEVNEDRDRLRQQVTTLETERSEWEKTKGATAQVEQLNKQIAEYDRILREVAAERHPALIGPINKAIESAIESAKEAVPKDQKDTVVALLRAAESNPENEATENALNEILDGLSVYRRAKLIKAMGDLEAAHKQKAGLAAQSQSLLEERQRQAQASTQALVKEFDNELADWTDPNHGIDMMMEKPGDQKHNERRTGVIDQAKAIFQGKLSPREVARAAIWAAQAKPLLDQNIAQAQLIEELRARITKLEGGGPTLTGTSESATGDQAIPDEKPPGMPLSQWILLQAKKEGVPIGRVY